MAKLKRIEEDNFLIPKKKEEEKKDEALIKPATTEDGLNTILQNELRQLHFKLR